MTYIYKRKQNTDLFYDLKRMDRANFSYDGAIALMEYLEEIATDTGEPIEYDPIAFCCDWAEYENIAEYNAAYGTEFDSWENADEHVIRVFNGRAIVENH